MCIRDSGRGAYSQRRMVYVSYPGAVSKANVGIIKDVYKRQGQTLFKSGFAPIIGTRCLGLNGWFSTNSLGNRDGLVLDEPANFHTKEVSKLSTLETCLLYTSAKNLPLLP